MVSVFLAAEGAALEATFKLVNQSKSIMSGNFRHSDILFVCSHPSSHTCPEALIKLSELVNKYLLQFCHIL